uniref:tRNA-splicing endonuclease subunit Sen34 n=1 Tax=Geotrypetes seraphini TaxID=260995 RepID=A0A6P8SQC8_GEOSA|nr:tRNA-splicing endonuclease subunit Sen34 [Geotrypetes seraphini]XP_033817097.1 tRNA-splicing endonuclease subunit Sen34 [Geotrypetes seraphini]XP_033817098.1 tRNA-splicing endonuclease subunit Sen34 [Geotrypetes seraphini]
MENALIPIHLLQGTALVWNMEDVRKIRQCHRLVGSLVGSLPRKPRQNARLGLPLQLLPEEARLLAEIRAAVLLRTVEHEKAAGGQDEGCDSEGSSSQGVEEVLLSEVAVYKQALNESYEEQWQLALQEKRSLLESLSEQIAQGRARRRHERGEQTGDPNQPANREDVKENFHFPQEAMMVQLPTARPAHSLTEVVDWQHPSPDWPHAGQLVHEIRYQVFRDLWEKGFFLTSGGKFGGDFLVYPGDPMRFHAHYIALCTVPDETLQLCDIVAAGRLGSNVKKTVLLCSAKQDGTVTYMSLQWAGL